jgi:molybdenum cofactor cytidylyltransferase
VAERVAILLLAAGSSARMRGRDKLMELVEGVPLLRRQTQRALATGCTVFVALPLAPHPRYDALAGLDCVQVPVADAAEGMSASLAAGLAALPPDCAAAMLLLADMPDIDESDLNTTLKDIDLKSETLIWRATTQDGRTGHPSVFRNTLFPDLMRLTGDQGGSAVVKAHPDKTAYVPLPDEHARTDLDTPEAWAEWRARQTST